LFQIVDVGTGATSDFHNEFDRNPITAKIDWQNKESGFWIQNIEINNHSPSFVGVHNIVFSTNLDATNINVNKVIGNHETVSVNAMFQPSNILDTTIDIQLTSYPSFPPQPSITIVLPSDVIPFSSCSVLPIIIK
jgi:hypothetical protein